ncbi:MAG TPA: 2-dehydropantoate 2-reductase [Blastocatellia bacterium]|nr:2-dehydropantoate 2-reductase [Blastocatellia bacterium]
MRFIIHGAGALGSLVGGMLGESGAEVILVSRPAHAAEINRQGLLVKSRTGDRTYKNIRAVTSPTEIRPHPEDVVLLTVKAQQSGVAVHALREVFPEETPIFCLQNGVRNEEVAAERFLHVYGAMAGLVVSYLSPGVIAHTMSNRIGIGNYPFGCDGLGTAVAAQLESAGFSVSKHESIMAVKWSKLLLNLNNATYAIIGAYLQLGLVTPSISAFTADVMEEGLQVLDGSGISLEDPDNPYDLRAHIAELRNVTEDLAKINEAQSLPEALRAYPSTWTDLKLKRGETEAGFFNGEIVLLGEKHHLPTPFNSALLQIVETIAADYDEPGYYTIEELADLVEQKRLKLYHS